MVSKKKFIFYALFDVLRNVAKAAKTTYYKPNPYLASVTGPQDTERQLKEMAKGVVKGVQSGYVKAKEEEKPKPKIKLSVKNQTEN